MLAVRFDDRLNTVLAQPAANPHDRAVRWRQLVELLARSSDLSSLSAQRGLEDVLGQAPTIDPQLRAAAARAVAQPHLPLPLVIVFAADAVAISAPVLAAASLQPSQWRDVLATASPDSRNFVASMYPDLSAWALAPAVPIEPVAPEVEPSSRPEPQPDPVVLAEPEPPRVVESTAEAQADTAPAPLAPAASIPPIPSISEVLARIEHLRQERQGPRTPVQPKSQPAPATVVQRDPDLPSPLFRWECGPSGEIAWVEGVPRGPLIGRSLANPGEHNGVDQRIQRAFAVRAPFRDAVLTVSGEGPAAGEWKVSGVPAFEPSDGRFAGYRGVGMRSVDAEEVELQVQPAQVEELDEDALRELIHELRTPLNAIIGFAEIIDGQYLGPADHSYRERAAEIVAQARLLLSAIEDLDVAARLRSSPEATDASTDLNAMLVSLNVELKERAAQRGARLDVMTARAAAICTLDQTVLERLLRRFCFALVDAAASKERLVVSVDCDVGQCLVSMNRPIALRGLSDTQLFGSNSDSPDVLASSFSLKLARGIAQTAGGDLRVTGEKLALILPRRRS